jgi:hypothetical protein
MVSIKDYSKEYIETEKGKMPVNTALDFLRYYYQEDILLGLYDYADELQDEFIFGQIRAIRRRRLQVRKNGPVASPGNLPRKTVTGNKMGIAESPLNYFAPRKNLQELLQQDWFVSFRTNKAYDEQWTNSLVKALMESEWKDGIARDWSAVGERSKCMQIKGYVIGLLKDNGVLKGSYDSIAEATNLAENHRSLSKYMGEGKRQPYAAWVKAYVESHG